MEPKILEEIQKDFKRGIIDFDWEPVRKQPKRYGISYPIIGYVISLVAISLMRLGVFMWLFLIAGFILFFVGIFCANGIIWEYKKGKGISEDPDRPSKTNFAGGPKTELKKTFF
jgi:hypothetical protein